MRRLHGVHVPHRKNTAGNPAAVLPTPAQVVIPMSMHIGAPAVPVVKAGDSVRVGQLIGEAAGFVSSPVHASVSGTVKAVEETVGLTGARTAAVRIVSDGEQTPYEGLRPPEVSGAQAFLDAVRASGAVGLGGAGFPTAVKLAVKEPARLDYIIINGAECEPYITSDTRTMTDEAGYVWQGIQLLQKYLTAKKIVIGIENNKAGPIRKMRELSAGSDVEVKALPAVYPQGGEKVLIYHATGRTVPEGGLPIDAGVVVLNCTTLAHIAKYLETGMPLVTKCVTVDGSAVREPKNVLAPIGTPVSALFDFCGGFKEEPGKILFGGPMMGIAVPDTDMPVVKSTNAVLAFNRRDAEVPAETACIRCARCAGRCPMRLMPFELETAYRLKKPELLERYRVNLCMECGCCAYTCPARRPLVQVMKLSKLMLRDYQNEKKQSTKGGGAR